MTEVRQILKQVQNGCQHTPEDGCVAYIASSCMLTSVD